jgi:polysaccharide export outer membrane protein
VIRRNRRSNERSRGVLASWRVGAGAVSMAVLSLVSPGATAAQGPTAGQQTAAVPVGPALDAAASRENYRIGSGDVLEIRVLGEEQMSSSGTRVSGDGFIQVPFVDEPIRAQCMTERELSEVVAERLKKWLKHPAVHVSVKEFNSAPVAIMGAVNSPGRFQMQRKVRLIELLTYAGGVKSDSGSVLHLVHAGEGELCEAPAPATGFTEATETVSLAKLLEGDLSHDRVMKPGDIVIIPNADLIFIAGEVLKPNSYPLREGLTVSQAIAQAGGPSAVAKPDKIRIVRQVPGKPREEIQVNLKDILSNKAPDVTLLANDMIEVPSSGGKTFFRNFFGALGGSVGGLPTRVIP